MSQPPPAEMPAAPTAEASAVVSGPSTPLPAIKIKKPYASGGIMGVDPSLILTEPRKRRRDDATPPVYAPAPTRAHPKTAKHIEEAHPGIEDTPEWVKEKGEELLDAIKAEREPGTGRHYAIDFLKLPDRDLYPDYYDIIKTPLCLEDIETRLKTGEYSKLGTVQREIEHCFWNAKKYNQKSSAIFEAARILHRVAKDAYAEILEAAAEEAAENAEGSAAEGGAKKPRKDIWVTLRHKLDEVIYSKDETEDRWLSTFFMDVVSKADYPDYYALIKKPRSFNSVSKKLKKREYATPSDFVDDVDLIFSNAQLYNQEDSQIAIDARRMKEIFHGLVDDIVAADAANPQPPRITLKVDLKGKGMAAAAAAAQEKQQQQQTPSIKIRVRPSDAAGSSTAAEAMDDQDADSKMDVDQVEGGEGGIATLGPTSSLDILPSAAPPPRSPLPPVPNAENSMPPTRPGSGPQLSRNPSSSSSTSGLSSSKAAASTSQAAAGATSGVAAQPAAMAKPRPGPSILSAFKLRAPPTTPTLPSMKLSTPEGAVTTQRQQPPVVTHMLRNERGVRHHVLDLDEGAETLELECVFRDGMLAAPPPVPAPKKEPSPAEISASAADGYVPPPSTENPGAALAPAPGAEASVVALVAETDPAAPPPPPPAAPTEATAPAVSSSPTVPPPSTQPRRLYSISAYLNGVPLEILPSPIPSTLPLPSTTADDAAAAAGFTATPKTRFKAVLVPRREAATSLGVAVGEGSAGGGGGGLQNVEVVVAWRVVGSGAEEGVEAVEGDGKGGRETYELFLRRW